MDPVNKLSTTVKKNQPNQISDPAIFLLLEQLCELTDKVKSAGGFVAFRCHIKANI